MHAHWVVIKLFVIIVLACLDTCTVQITFQPCQHVSRSGLDDSAARAGDLKKCYYSTRQEKTGYQFLPFQYK